MGFNEHEYAINVKSWTNKGLRSEWEDLGDRLGTLDARSLVCSVAVPATLGLSFIGSYFALKQMDVLAKKIVAISAELASRGDDFQPKKRIFFKAFALTVATAGMM